MGCSNLLLFPFLTDPVEIPPGDSRLTRVAQLELPGSREQLAESSPPCLNTSRSHLKTLSPFPSLSPPSPTFSSSPALPVEASQSFGNHSASFGEMSLQQQGSERDLPSAASSVSLPSVRKTPKKRRISLRSLFRRRCGDSKSRKSRALPTGVDGIASVESVHSEMCQQQDHVSALSVPGATYASSSSSSASTSELLECPLCLLRHTRDRFPDIMTCHHRSCADCLRQYLRIEISESRVNISCPECSERFNPHDIRMILNDRVLMEKYEEFMLRRWLVADPDCRWCPAPDCG